jgi:hypothetical protein
MVSQFLKSPPERLAIAMKPLLLLAFGSLMYLGTSGGHRPDAAPHPGAAATGSSEESTALAVPEPTMMLLAGIGGITLLVFAIRRK